MADLPPVDETPERCPPAYWITLGLLVVAHVEFGVFLSPAGIYGNSTYHFLLAPVLGFLFSQPLLCAFWTAFAPQPFYHRVLCGLPICALLAFAVELGNLMTGGRVFSYHESFCQPGFFLSMYLLLYLTATLLLLLARQLFRWRLTRPAAEPVSYQYRESQFGVKHLLILTAVTALVCGLFRSLTVIDPSVYPHPSREVAALVFEIIIVLLPIALVPWLTLVHHRDITLSILCAVVSFGPIAVVCGLMYRFALIRGSPEDSLFIQFGAISSVFVSTLTIRSCGFRMIRQAKP
jgi:hypothetical protein